MADFPTRDELFQRFKAAALAVPNTRISPREIDRAGSDINLIAAAAAVMGEEVVTRMAFQFRGIFEDTAKGTQLDRVVFDRKGVPRNPAAPSLINFNLARPTAGGGTGTIFGALPGNTPPPTRVVNQTGIVYLLTQSAAFTASGPGSLGPFEVTGQAQLAGTAYEVDKNQTWSFLDNVFDGTVAVTNPAESAGAGDFELDDHYRARAKAFFPTIRRGTLPAIQFGLESTPGVDSASSNEVVNPQTGLIQPYVLAYVLDILGQANDTLAAQALLNLLDFRAAGIPVIVSPATPLYQAIQLLLAFDTTIVGDTIKATKAVKNAIVTAMDNLRPGQMLRRSVITSAALSVAGVIVENDSLVVPAGDLVAPTPRTAFRTKPELITTT